MPDFVDTSPAHSCIFCRIVAGELPATKIYEDELTIAFLDISQVNPGHTLVIVKRHADNLLELTADEAAAAMRTAHKVAHAVKAAFDAPGITLLQANGKEGFQTVFHFHLHVVPRHADDGITLGWPRKNPSREQLESYAAQLSDALAKNGE